MSNPHLSTDKSADLQLNSNALRYKEALAAKNKLAYKNNPYMNNGYCASHFCVDEPNSKDRMMKEILHGSGNELTIPIDQQQLLWRAQGWWADTINCQQNSANNLYCKPKKTWIWPY